MGLPRFEVLTGVVNGFNDTFFTSAAYTAGTVAVFLNGQLLKSNLPSDPWAETDPSTGEITMAGDCIPRDGDVVAAFYTDTLDDFVGSEVTPISATIYAQDEVAGEIGAVSGVEGSVTQTSAVYGTIAEAEDLSGAIVEVEEIAGTVSEC